MGLQQELLSRGGTYGDDKNKKHREAATSNLQANFQLCRGIVLSLLLTCCDPKLEQVPCLLLDKNKGIVDFSLTEVFNNKILFTFIKGIKLNVV